MPHRLIALSLAWSAIAGVSTGAEPASSSERGIRLSRPEAAVHAIAEDAIFAPAEEATLYTLRMLVCEAGGARPCEFQEQIVEGFGMHPGTAFVQAQPLVARWLETHPGYVVRSWRVLPGRGA